MADEGRKTSQEYWESTGTSIRMRLPSRLNVAVKDLQDLLKQHVKPGMKFLEVGCAPGKTLAWVASRLKAEVAGVDYSDVGIANTRQLMNALGIEADLRNEDVFQTSFPSGSFDIVYSGGVIEHFDDPREIVRIHVDLLKPGGKAIITVPNYRGVYGKVQAYLDPESLTIHNLEIMTRETLQRLAPADLVSAAKTYPAGSVTPWILSLDKKLPRVVSKPLSLFVNGIGVLQPVSIPFLSPHLVLELTRNDK